MIAPQTLYPSDPRCLISLFDLRRLGAEERLRRGVAGWRGSADVEKFYPGWAALVIRPGGALGLPK